MEVIAGVPYQPFVSLVRRLLEGMQFAGRPVSKEDESLLREAMKMDDEAAGIAAIQKILNRYCLVDIHINPEARVKLARGEARAELIQQGWSAFLVRVQNEPKVAAQLRVSSKNSMPTIDPKANMLTDEDVRDRWMQVEAFTGRPLNPRLSGLLVDYRIVLLYSRDEGMREGHLAFNIGHGTQDLGFRNDLYVLFDCMPAVQVELGIKDYDGEGAMCSLVVVDEQGRLYPLPARRQEPDFFFQEQVYRADGEHMLLPPGRYTVHYTRGPEYLRKETTWDVPNKKEHKESIQLERWINPAKWGWYSGDHHIHAAGCKHYKSPGIGVSPAAMMRHIEGEGLNVGNVLTWGPGWYHQKQFFTGAADEVSTDEHVIRYDVEVSMFPSDHTGHLCLMGLTEDDYPGTEEKEEWPSWGMPVLEWAKSQGAVTGIAHSGSGLDVYPEDRLPNYVIPPMDGIGAQEFVVQAAHGLIDFTSTVDTAYVSELNMWYHVLNCGFPIKTSGETDFPCIDGQRVGLGRSYVKLTGPRVDYREWVQGVGVGRAYVSEGGSHFLDFRVNGVELGGPEDSTVKIAQPGPVTITTTIAAYLDEEVKYTLWGADNWDSIVPPGGNTTKREHMPIRDLPYTSKPSWHIERARIDDTREVSVELIVNGLPVASRRITADGSVQDLTFNADIVRSSWVALRILGSSHTNPIVVEVGAQPVRASRLSAEWALDTIDELWFQKAERIRPGEREAARAAYDEARAMYRGIRDVSYDDTATLPADDRTLWDEQRVDIAERVQLLEMGLRYNDGVLGKVNYKTKVRAFTDTMTLRMDCEPGNSEIRYALDGSEPTLNSRLYEDPIHLVKTTTIRARGFIREQPSTAIDTAVFTRYGDKDFRAPMTPAGLKPGMRYRYYEGDWADFASIDTDNPATEGTSNGITIEARARDLYYALIFDGYIEVPEDGIYTFFTNSNDGSMLYIDDQLVVDNDGLHGMMEKSGHAALRAGLHPIQVRYFNAGGQWGLNVAWASPDMPKGPITPDVLSRVLPARN
jgi:hypothetical protein